MNFRGYNFSDTVYVTFAQGSAIEDVITRGDVELKQTVVQDELTINLNTQGVSQLKIFNTAGIMCVDDKIAGGIASYPVNVSALPQGMYILTVVNNSKTYTFRFVKTN
ncbi:T9SS type A sorting domain-containing protein [Dysgonomonas sp. 216]|uniref:T9SS type A sorting domain-containing protein n=1 Tax=Dysgonomonas sp. 216 TaxID=2302934 RepID=UPI00351A7D10